MDSDMDRKDKSSTSDAQITFFVSGFGPFGEFKENPTSAIIQSLKQEQTAQNPKLCNVNLSEVVRVAASTATEEVNKITQHVKSSQQNNPSPGQKKHAVIIHFGVSHMKGQKKSFRLEQNAFNEAHFRIPDEDGFRPKHEQISESRPLCHRLSTDLNALGIKDHLEKKGFEVSLSDDAGRFVCNYIYWSSLEKVQEEKVSRDADDIVIMHCMFVHVPTFEDISKETQVDFSIELIDSIKESIHAKSNNEKKQGMEEVLP